MILNLTIFNYLCISFLGLLFNSELQAINSSLAQQFTHRGLLLWFRQASDCLNEGKPPVGYDMQYTCILPIMNGCLHCQDK